PRTAAASPGFRSSWSATRCTSPATTAWQNASVSSGMSDEGDRRPALRMASGASANTVRPPAERDAPCPTTCAGFIESRQVRPRSNRDLLSRPVVVRALPGGLDERDDLHGHRDIERRLLRPEHLHDLLEQFAVDVRRADRHGLHALLRERQAAVGA